MEWSLKIATVRSVPVRIHVTLILALVWLWLIYFEASGVDRAWEAVGFMVAVFACILAHELGHTFVAQHFGIRIMSITLYPVGGAASMIEETRRPREELLIALAGPLVNLVLFVVLYVVFGKGDLGQLVGISQQSSAFILRLASANLFLAVFNLIPAFPMDGAHILRSILSQWFDRVAATKATAVIGQGAAIILGFVGLFTDPMLLVIALLIFLSASSEAREADLLDISEKADVRDIMITEFETFTPTTSLQQAVDRLLATTQSEFPVVDGGGKLLGLVTRADIVFGLREKGPDAICGQIMKNDAPSVSDRMPLAEALSRLRAAHIPAIVVVDETGQPMGLINYENIGEMLMVREAVNDSYLFAHLHQRNARRARPGRLRITERT